MDEQTTFAELRAAVARFVAARAWQNFHPPKHLAMSIAIEAAEIMEHFQWLTAEEGHTYMADPVQRAEVADELAARATLSTQLAAQRNLVNASRKAYELSNTRYRLGTDSFLATLDAQRSLFTAQQSEIEIRKQRLANIVNLYKTLGGGQIVAEAKPEGK